MRLVFLVYLLVFTVSTNPAGLRYLVLLKKSETIEKFLKFDFTLPVTKRLKNFITRYYSIGDLVGFSGTFTRSALERIKRCPLVAEIAEDVEFGALDLVVQENAPTHLVRLSEAYVEDKRTSYFYESKAQGQGVLVYIVDTGVQTDHTEFGGRAYLGQDFTSEGPEDLNGHGTHVAGIVASRTYGVAKAATIVALKTLQKSGLGSLSNILGAIEFAVKDRMEKGINGVLNLSLGAPYNELLDRVLDSASATGLVVVVAAGNQNADACDMLPAGLQLVITVGAVDTHSSNIASFSNWGPCVDVFTAGVDIESVDAKGNLIPQTLSGTSMAAPIISGLVANLLSDGVQPDDIKSEIIALARPGMMSRRSLRGKKGTPNLEAYNGCDPLTELDRI